MDFAPPTEEQARHIISRLRADPQTDIDESVEPEDIHEYIDPGKPVSVNMSVVMERLGLK